MNNINFYLTNEDIKKLSKQITKETMRNIKEYLEKQ
jgi:hypothetical protein